MKKFLQFLINWQYMATYKIHKKYLNVKANTVILSLFIINYELRSF